MYGKSSASPVVLSEWRVEFPDDCNLQGATLDTCGMHFGDLGLHCHSLISMNTKLFDVEVYYDLHDLQRHCDTSIEDDWLRLKARYLSSVRFHGLSGSSPTQTPPTKKVFTGAFQNFRQCMVSPHLLLNETGYVEPHTGSFQVGMG